MEVDGKGRPCQQDGNSPDSQILGYSGPNLPEDIWCYIHSLMPMRDAAQVACVARAFFCSWRCHPNLDFSRETLRSIGVKAFKFHVPSVYNGDSAHLDHLDSWLQIAVKPGLNELRLILTTDGKYNFPCSLLSGETGDPLRYLSLACCHFHPTVKLGCFRSLTKLQLSVVHITASELGWFLSNSFALEQLKLWYRNDIDCLKIPCLQRLSYLEVVCCTGLQAIESKAPNLSSVWVTGDLHIQLSLENTCRIKILNRHCSNFTFYARTNLPSIMPNLEALSIRSDIGVIREFKECVSVFEDQSDLRMMPGHHPSKLKHVKIIKFSAAKSVAELTCHILESATSLESLTLDTTHGMPRCSVNRIGKCVFLLKEALVEAQKGVLAAQAFIKPKVPSTVEFNVFEPCSRCYAVEL
uniref:At1g61320/AtMIF1 LRR domain-containing protein n=1 Tax=Setaria italica TaxID=4555 RepID=K3YSX5_SETIT